MKQNKQLGDYRVVSSTRNMYGNTYVDGLMYVFTDTRKLNSGPLTTCENEYKRNFYVRSRTI